MTLSDTVGTAVLLERHEAYALTRLTLNRPARGNSLSAAMVEELAHALEACRRDETRVLLIEASGTNFCTGFDLSALDEEDDDSLLARFVRLELLLQQLYRAPFITVAVASGKALGAGADLFAACSQRWVLEDASFAFPGAGFGLVLGTGRLALRVGAAQAEAWVAAGKRIDAATAVASGLASMRAEGAPLAAALALAGGAGRLDAETLAAIRVAADPRDAADDALDLARLVRSAARPGLVERIRAYRVAAARR
jgi:enoyl-CoA hydratase